MSKDNRSDAELNRIIAGWMGWIRDPETGGWIVAPAGSPDEPDYCSNLNSICQAVETLRYRDDCAWFDYGKALMDECGSFMNCAQAAPRVRAEILVAAVIEAMNWKL